jgi:hypothetical protein
MPTFKAFTYNTGSTLQGTEQIGDLAIGISDQDYSNNYGDLIWWNGMDEDGKYIIGKDIPTQDQSTPLGNIGSVEFWSTSTRTTSSFISLVNGLSNNSFTTVSESLGWLSGSGYWSNYSAINGSDFDSGSSWEMRANSSTQTINSNIALYDPLYKKLIFGTTNPSTNFWNTPYLISSSDIPTSGNSNVFNTPYVDNQYFTEQQGNPYLYEAYGFLTHDTASNYLFAQRGDSQFTQGDLRGIVKWDLSDYSLESSVDYRVRGNGVNNQNGDSSKVFQTWCPANDKVYATGQFSPWNQSTRYEVQIYSGSDFTADMETFSNPSNGIGRIFSSTDNSGEILWINGGGTTSRWYLISGSGFHFTGSLISATTNAFNTSGPVQFAYSKTSKKFYAQSIAPTGVGKQIASILVVDPSTRSSQQINFGGLEDLGQNFGCTCVWDSNRNCIWTTDLDGKLFAFDCGSDTIVKANIQLEGVYSIGNPMVVDTVNDQLTLIGSTHLVYNLNDIWPR